jgi:YidC/Oxa1 family membrane protein insertase
MERNTILAVVLSVLVLLVWYIVFPPSQPEVPQQAPQEVSPGVEQETSSSETPSGMAPSGKAVIPSASGSHRQLSEDAEKISVDTPLLSVVLTTEGARLLEWKLKAHQDTNEDLVDLVSNDARTLGLLPLQVFTQDQSLTDELNFGFYQASVRTLTLEEEDEPATISLSYETEAGGIFTKTLTFSPDSYKVDITMQFSNVEQAGEALSVAWGPGAGNNLGFSTRFQAEVTSKNREQSKLVRDAAKKIDGLMTRTNVEWAAINRKYFTAAMFPENLSNTLSINKIALSTEEEEEKIDPIRQMMIGISQPLQEGACRMSLYVGPKEYARLSAAYPGFEQLINYGTFWFIAKPLAAFMAFLYSYVKNYGLVIICLTILIKILFYPLTHKSFQSMQKMQNLQPKLKAVQEKYKNDKQAQQKAVMEFYQKEGVNPMGSCLPMLLQIPVFFALYQTLLQSIELRGAIFLWIPDLSAPEPAFFGFFKPLVLLMGASMFLQQSMTPTTADNKQAQMFKFLPILFTAMFWNFPSGLVLYWFMNNILTIGQQYLIRKGGEKFSKTKDSTPKESSSSRKRRKKAA